MSNDKIIQRSLMFCFLGALFFILVNIVSGAMIKIILIALGAAAIRMAYACAINPILLQSMNLFPIKSGMAAGIILFSSSIVASISCTVASLQTWNLFCGLTLLTIVLVLTSALSFRKIVKIKAEPVDSTAR